MRLGAACAGGFGSTDRDQHSGERRLGKQAQTKLDPRPKIQQLRNPSSGTTNQVKSQLGIPAQAKLPVTGTAAVRQTGFSKQTILARRKRQCDIDCEQHQ